MLHSDRKMVCFMVDAPLNGRDCFEADASLAKKVPSGEIRGWMDATQQFSVWTDNPAMTSTPTFEASAKAKLSMLDLVSVREVGTVAQALALALRTARHAESG
jgi:hypothetical protein